MNFGLNYSDLDFYALSGLFNFFMSLMFGVFVYLRNRKSEVNKSFLFFCLSIMFWSGPYFFWQISTDAPTALFFTRALMVGTIMISVTFVHFALAVLNLHEKQKKFLFWTYALFWFFNVANVFTPLVVKSVAPFLGFQFWPQPGILFHPFLASWLGYATYGTVKLARSYGKADKTLRAQLRYVFFGILIAYVSGSTNWPGWYGIPIPPFLTPIVSLYFIMLGYAALKHHLFNIRVLVVEILTFVIWGVLLARVFTSGPSINLFIINLLIFFAVVVIGIFLIRAGLHEAKLNDTLADLNQNLQKKVDEQTKQIRGAYEIEKKAKEELLELNREKNDFILAAQHNLRTPLTVAMGYVQDIDSKLKSGKTEDLNNSVQKTEGALDTMAQLVNQLLDVTSLEVGKGGLMGKQSKQ